MMSSLLFQVGEIKPGEKVLVTGRAYLVTLGGLSITYWADPPSPPLQPPNHTSDVPPVRAVPEIFLRVGGPQALFCSVGGGGCFVDNVSKGWGS